MLAKIWKKILLFILIVACLFDVTIKLTKRNSLKNEIDATIKYFSNDNVKVENTENVKESSKEQNKADTTNSEKNVGSSNNNAEATKNDGNKSNEVQVILPDLENVKSNYSSIIMDLNQ